MKKDRILKTLAVLGAASTFAFGGLCACADNQKPTESPTEPNPPIVNPDDPKPDDPKPDDSKPTEKTDEEIFAEKVAEAETFFHAIDKNVTIDYIFEWGGSTFVSTVVYDDNKSKVVEGSDVTYYEQDGDQRYSYSNENGQWTKDFCEEDFYSFLNLYIEYFDRVEWATYDKENNQLVSKDNDTVKASDDKTTILLSNVNGGVLRGDFSKVGTSSVELPREFVDNTQAQEENIYEIVDGQKVWNMPLISQTIQDWMEEKNYVTSKIGYGVETTLDKLLFMNIDTDKFELGMVLTSDGVNVFQIYNGTIGLIKALNNAQSKDDIVNALNAESRPIGSPNTPITIEYSNILSDYEIHREEFEKMTESVSNKIGLDMDKIYFAFKTEQTTPMAAGELGYLVAWNHYYLAKIDGEIKFIKTQVSSSIDRGENNAIANVVKNDPKYWGCSVKDEKILDNENLKLYENTKNIEKSMEL